MNEEIILNMAQPYVRDSSITYDEFDNIYSVLSRKEQYTVVEILFAQGINLVDKHVEEDTLVLDIDDPDENDFNCDDDFEVLYDESLFKDKCFDHETINELVVHKVIKQSNGILCSLIQEGNKQAMQDLCVKNKKLVDKYVIAYEKRYGNRLDFEDLEQVGFMGLITAAQKFNTSQGAAFSTYAVYWIKQAISREIMDNGYAIRIPVHMMERINRVVAAENRLSGLDIAFRNRVTIIANELGITEENVLECLTLKKNYLSYSSLDLSIGEDGETELGEIIPDEGAKSLEAIIMDKELRKEMLKLLEVLKPRERKVIELRYGWNDEKARTLEEIGEMFGVTRERIRQIEAKAIKKLSNSRKSKQLRVFWEE